MFAKVVEKIPCLVALLTSQVSLVNPRILVFIYFYAMSWAKFDSELKLVKL